MGSDPTNHNNEAFDSYQTRIASEAKETIMNKPKPERKDMGTNDAKPLPEFKKLDVSKMETQVSDAQGLTWGPTPDGAVIEHN